MVDSSDPAGRRDFVQSDPILITFQPSTRIQEQEVFIPLVQDDINEATEGFFVIVVAENISSEPSLTINLGRGGVTLMNILDDDRKQL